MRWISSPEFTEWQAFDELEPIEDQAWQSGMIAATIANVNRSKGHRPFRPEDFMAVSEEEQLTPEQRQQLLRERIDSLMFAAGGRIKGQPAPARGGRKQAQQRRKDERR